MKKYNIFSVILCAVIGMISFSSCLKDGDETFALEGGDLDDMIKSSWIVEKTQLYDPLAAEYHSDLMNDPQLGVTYTFAGSRTSTITSPEGQTSRLNWYVNEDDHTLILPSGVYTIESLGRKLMVISKGVVVNNESYLAKYYLRNLGYEGDDMIDDGDDDATYVVSTSGHGFFRRNGYGFNVPVGAVPKGDNGNDGSVAFSAIYVPIEELPADAPSGVTFVEGSGILANPANFIFASPIFIDVPLRGQSLASARFYRWNAIERRWDVVPFSHVNSDGTVRTSNIELGYFALGVTQNNQNSGGIRIPKSEMENGYYYYVSLSRRTGDQASFIGFSDGSDNLYMANIPFGEYTAQITREKRTTLENGALSIESSKAYIGVTVTDPLIAGGNGFASYTGWTDLGLREVEWQTGRPSSWGEETVTYGTGMFQATLNWINYSGSTVDYDLHLTLPSGGDVYYAHKSEGGFELDRDVISAIGNCTENIYSVSDDLPAGTYTVRVHHYGGATGRNYNCRVILDGRVVSAYSGITNSGYQTIYSFTLQ